jgi:hypothetical protein
VQGVIYCESCLADRLHGNQPPITPPPTSAGFVGTPGAIPSGNAPNPALAGLLSIFPGVGSVYAGQYTKGLAYMGIFILLILGTIHVSGLVFGLALGFFVVYQFIDAIQTAKALQVGQPAPDPLGVAQIFSPGQKVDSSKIPIGAVVLIGLGVMLLLWNVLDFDFWSLVLPLILVGLGVWLAATKLGLTGQPAQAQARNFMGPAILITLGFLFLVQSHGPGLGRTWPVLLLVIGVIKLLGNSNLNTGMQPPMPPPAAPPASGPIEGEVQPPSNEVRHG